MKRILNTISQKWPEYLLEILVITIGILGAFGLNNWNEFRKTSLREADILEEINYEFKENLEEYYQTKKNHQQAAENGQWLLNHYPYFDTISSDSIASRIWGIIGPVTFEPSESTIEALISTQSFNIIKNKELRMHLIKWKDALKDHQKFERYGQTFTVDIMIPYLARYLDLQELSDGEIGSRKLFNEVETKNMFYRRTNFANSMINRNNIENRMIEIIALTEPARSKKDH